MPYDEGQAQILREALEGQDGITEKKMFGGLCFLMHGNMVCGVHKDGAMFRVGKENEAAAMSVQGAGPMMFTGRKMGGMIDASDDALGDDDRRGQLLKLALDFVKTLPAK